MIYLFFSRSDTTVSTPRPPSSASRLPIHPNTLRLAPRQPTTGQPDNRADRQARYTHVRPSWWKKGKQKRDEKGRRETFRTKENAALAKPRMGFSIGFSSFAKLTIKSPQFHCSHSPVRFQAFFPANFTQKSRYARPRFPACCTAWSYPRFLWTTS